MKQLIIFISLSLLFTSCDEETGSNKNCGDGILDTGEACDGAQIPESCISLGYHSGSVQCTDDCRLVTTQCEESGRCGDGEFQAGFEECEGSFLNSESCETLGRAGGVLACNDDCTFDMSQCNGTCNDGILQPEETCDGTLLNDLTCESFGYYGGTLACETNCEPDFSGCSEFGWCGDGIIQESEGETCDGTDMGVHTCENMGFFNGGSLSCDDTCNISTEGCYQFTSVTAGNRFTCAITAQGETFCWGMNDSGELGNASAGAFSLSPVLVDGGLDFTSLTYGGQGKYACGQAANGAAHCWGQNTFGQLGDESTSDSNTPVPVSIASSFTALTTGSAHSCGIVSTGDTYCWGQNNYGQLGNNSTSNSTQGVLVSANRLFESVSAGMAHTCAIAITNNTLYCWGQNGLGQLGTGGLIQSEIPTQVATTNSFSAVSAGGLFTCALTLTNAAYCWGQNSFGQLGNNSTANTSLPASVSGGHTFVSIKTSLTHACALDDTGALYCWGQNDEGQLGNASTNNSSIPYPVDGGLLFTDFALGETHTCGITTDGNLYCWGSNSYGCLGDGTTSQRRTPTLVVVP